MQRKIRFAFIQRSLNLAFPNQTVADDFFYSSYGAGARTIV